MVASVILAATVGPFTTPSAAMAATCSPDDSQPVASLFAVKGFASETSPAQVDVVRGGNPTAAVTVYYSVGGTAVEGVDYMLVPPDHQVFLAPGAGAAPVQVVMLASGAGPLPKTVDLVLESDSHYEAAFPTQATVLLLDGGDSVAAPWATNDNAACLLQSILDGLDDDDDSNPSCDQAPLIAPAQSSEPGPVDGVAQYSIGVRTSLPAVCALEARRLAGVLAGADGGTMVPPILLATGGTGCDQNGLGEYSHAVTVTATLQSTTYTGRLPLGLFGSSVMFDVPSQSQTFGPLPVDTFFSYHSCAAAAKAAKAILAEEARKWAQTALATGNPYPITGTIGYLRLLDGGWLLSLSGEGLGTLHYSLGVGAGDLDQWDWTADWTQNLAACVLVTTGSCVEAVVHGSGESIRERCVTTTGSFAQPVDVDDACVDPTFLRREAGGGGPIGQGWNLTRVDVNDYALGASVLGVLCMDRDNDHVCASPDDAPPRLFCGSWFGDEPLTGQGHVYVFVSSTPCATGTPTTVALGGLVDVTLFNATQGITESRCQYEAGEPYSRLLVETAWSLDAESLASAEPPSPDGLDDASNVSRAPGAVMGSLASCSWTLPEHGDDAAACRPSEAMEVYLDQFTDVQAPEYQPEPWELVQIVQPDCWDPLFEPPEGFVPTPILEQPMALDDPTMIALRDSMSPLRTLSEGGEAGCTPPENSACTVLFIHGWAGLFTSSNEVQMNGWNDLVGLFEAGGYDVLKVGYYGGSCGIDADAADAWPQSGPWAGKNHQTGLAYTNKQTKHVQQTGCNGVAASNRHTKDTDPRHLAFHLAWFIYNEYSQHDEYVDIVGHSMAGLLTRYLLAMVQLRTPDWPPKLLIDDVVTMNSPVY